MGVAYTCIVALNRLNNTVAMSAKSQARNFPVTWWCLVYDEVYIIVKEG